MANREQHALSFQWYRQAIMERASFIHSVYGITSVEPSKRKSPGPTDGSALPLPLYYLSTLFMAQL
jgi:hypothetical protein